MSQSGPMTNWLERFFFVPLPFSLEGIIDSDKKLRSDTKAIVSKGYHNYTSSGRKKYCTYSGKVLSQKMLDQKKKKKLGLTSGVVTEDMKTKVYFYCLYKKKPWNTINIWSVQYQSKIQI